MGELLSFLAAHAVIIEAVMEAIGSGASKESILKAIRASMIEASDAAMKAELGE